MFVCSVSTVLINGNPLLRYDGYYVLADWLGAPNLQQQAAAAIRRGLAWLLAGVSLDQPRFLAEPHPAVLWSYAGLSLIYRGVVLVGIIWFLDRTLRSWGLGTVSVLIAAVVVASVAAGPIVRTAGFLKNPSLARQISGRWLLVSLLVIFLVASVLAFTPLPARVSAPVMLRAENGRQVYIATSGQLVSAKPAGTRVTTGETIAQLSNRRLELQVSELASRAAQQRLIAAHLALRQHRDPALGDQLPAAEARLVELNGQLVELRRELARLQLVAPESGTILPPPGAPRSDNGDVGPFAGTPQAPYNAGCYLEAGQLLCTIGDAARSEAVAVVDQADVQLLKVDQKVRLALRHVPGRLLSGRVREISRLDSEELPPQILAERMVPLHRAASGKLQPTGTYYQVVISLEAGDEPLVPGGIGWARIQVAPQPLWLRAYRGLRGTLRTPW
jgi:putative peptide zinc metalloprotease protein